MNFKQEEEKFIILRTHWLNENNAHVQKIRLHKGSSFKIIRSQRKQTNQPTRIEVASKIYICRTPIPPSRRRLLSRIIKEGNNQETQKVASKNDGVQNGNHKLSEIKWLNILLACIAMVSTSLLRTPPHNPFAATFSLLTD